MVPDQSWNLVSIGAKESVEESKDDRIKFMDGQNTFWVHSFEECPRVPTYIMNLCAGDFEVFSSII